MIYDKDILLLLKIMKVCIVIISILKICFFQPTPPIFPDQYEMGFNETASIGALTGNTTGKIYLDAKNNR